MPDVEEQVSYEEFTVEELKEELRDRGLHTSGNKDELIARLEESDAGASVEQQDAGVEPLTAPSLPTDNPNVINTLERIKGGTVPDRFPAGQVDATLFCASPLGWGEGKPGYTPAGGSGAGGANQALRHSFHDKSIVDRTACANGTPIADFVAPASGLQAGSTNVTIKGSRLTGVSTVVIGGTTATNILVRDDSTITCTTPSHTGAGPVNVVVGGYTLTNGYTYI